MTAIDPVGYLAAMLFVSQGQEVNGTAGRVLFKSRQSDKHLKEKTLHGGEWSGQSAAE